jgi:hypothetical protein
MTACDFRALIQKAIWPRNVHYPLSIVLAVWQLPLSSSALGTIVMWTRGFRRRQDNQEHRLSAENHRVPCFNQLVLPVLYIDSKLGEAGRSVSRIASALMPVSPVTLVGAIHLLKWATARLCSPFLQSLRIIYLEYIRVSSRDPSFHR